MKVLDLFSGIGGFSLGLERAGMETVAFCEIDPFCRKVLKKHWPDVPIHEDIGELDGTQYRESVDLVCGGFPCQPFSQAGLRRGTDDDRALWPEMLRVIREVQPTWVIGENVIGLETMGLEHCVSDLESNGFEVQVFDIPACGVGANHRRHRLWIVANANSLRCNPRGAKQSLQGFGASSQAQGIVANTTGNGLQRTNKPRSMRRAENAERPSNAIGTHGDNGGRPTEPPVCGADDGIPNRVDRLRSLGNAVVPQIPEIIGRAILET